MSSENNLTETPIKKTFVFDFDSTLTAVEAFEELAEISLKGDPKKDEKIAKIAKITDQGVDGDITFTESLERRLKILDAHRDHLDHPPRGLAPQAERLREGVERGARAGVDFVEPARRRRQREHQHQQ